MEAVADWWWRCAFLQLHWRHDGGANYPQLIDDLALVNKCASRMLLCCVSHRETNMRSCTSMSARKQIKIV